MSLFDTIRLNINVSVKIDELNSLHNIIDLFNLKLKEYNNKCLEYGYIKEDSIVVKKKSVGYLNPVIFSSIIEYKLECEAQCLKPEKGNIYVAEIISINKIGIMCIINYYDKHNKRYSPIKVIISKQRQDDDISKLKIGNNIHIEILGYKFIKNANCINTIANVLSKKKLNEVLGLKKIIIGLRKVEIGYEIDVEKYKKHSYMVRFILKDDIIRTIDLYIYNFIVECNINNKMKNINTLYEEYNLKNNKKRNINNEEESDNMIVYNTILETDEYPEEETLNLDDLDSEIKEDDYDEDKMNNDKNNVDDLEQEDIDVEDNEDNEEDNEEDDDEENEEEDEEEDDEEKDDEENEEENDEDNEEENDEDKNNEIKCIRNGKICKKNNNSIKIKKLIKEI